MTGDGRADYVTIDPDNGCLDLWINRCWEIDTGGGTGSGDGGASGPSQTEIEVPSCITKVPEVEDLIEQDFIPAKAGDVFIHDFEDDSDRFVQVILVGEAEDFPNIDCGVHDVKGEDGNDLSCEAQGVAWLLYSIFQLGEPITDVLTRRDGLEARRVTVYGEWRPKTETDKGCTTPECMLMRHAPLDTWVFATNGTYHGQSFSHQFANFGDFIGHRVHTGQVSIGNHTSGKQLSEREYYYESDWYVTSYYHPAQRFLFPCPS